MSETNRAYFAGQDAVRHLIASIQKVTLACLLIQAMGIAPLAKAEVFGVENVSELNGAHRTTQSSDQ